MRDCRVTRDPAFARYLAYHFPSDKLTGFGYWLGFEPMAGVTTAVRDSSETFGVRFAGEKPLRALKLAYAASYATQREYADNPLTFDLNYTLLELTGSFRQYSVGVGMEVLEGDGVKVSRRRLARYTNSRAGLTNSTPRPPMASMIAM